MTTTSDWQKFQSLLYSNSELGLYLDLSQTGLSPEDLNTHHSLFSRAFESMQALELGEIANPDENRQVGHYWLRNPELAPTPDIQAEIIETKERISKFADEILAGNILAPNGQAYTHLLLIGIGGSALGPQFLHDALATDQGLKVYFLDNTDPDGMDRVFNDLDDHLNQTLVLVISKSGGTAETRNGMLETQHIFKKDGLDFSRQSVAVTGIGSQLYQIASDENWLEVFPMWDWVGGRTSVMSAVGLLPAALMGVDLDAFLSAASSMDELTRSPVLIDNPAALLALTWYILGEGKGSKDMVILPYKDRLLLFSRYLQQLIMESLGKARDLDGDLVEQGIAVYGNKGSTDQHAYVQQLRDGLDNFFITFIEVLKERDIESIPVDTVNTSGEYLLGFFLGTQTALSQNNRKSLVITVKDISPASIGALIALYERAVGFYANFININAYHQPGVEAGKKAAGEILQLKNRIIDLLQGTNTSLTIEEIAFELHAQGSEHQIYMILRHLAANRALDLTGSFHQPSELKVGISAK